MFILLPMEPAYKFEEGTEQGSPVIIHQFDQPGFLHQAAEFNQVAGACAPVLHPLALVIAGAIEIEPIAQHGQPSKLDCRCQQFRQQRYRLLLWSPACPLAERSLARVRPTSRRLRVSS